MEEKKLERGMFIYLFFLGLEICMECNKYGIINEILIRMLVLMSVFFDHWIFSKSNGLENV